MVQGAQASQKAAEGPSALLTCTPPSLSHNPHPHLKILKKSLSDDLGKAAASGVDSDNKIRKITVRQVLTRWQNYQIQSVVRSWQRHTKEEAQNALQRALINEQMENDRLSKEFDRLRLESNARSERRGAALGMVGMLKSRCRLNLD